jgi:hypothetical protein
MSQPEPAPDLFISHASEDKAAVARPLADALMSRGWRVWLDELELTVGDSLSGRIDAALAQTRFGVVILSPSFFAKPWPQRELAGLAAREVAAGSKVILPVWHEVDRDYIVERSPVLADRLGALTASGIDHVAEQISTALRRASRPALVIEGATEPIVQAIPGSDLAVPGVPRTASETEELLAVRPPAWEYLHFAGVLAQGLDALELKWHDHQMQMPRGPRRHLESGELSASIGWIVRRTEALMRVFDPGIQEKAFGAPGEPGDPVRIRHFAMTIVNTYEALMDWAAELRNTTTPLLLDEAVAIVPQMVDQPLKDIRDFIESAVRETSALPARMAEAKQTGEPITIHLTMVLTVDQQVMDDFSSALQRANDSMTDDEFD